MSRFSRLETFVKPFVPLLSTPTLRPREAPREENPEAFIEWGAQSQFGGDFRDQVKKPPNFNIVEELRPLHGLYVEEGRRWTDIQISNPEDESTSVVIRRTDEIAFKAPDNSPFVTRDPSKEQEAQVYGKGEQIRFSFNNEYQSAGGPVHFNSNGEEFEPIVLDPFTEVIEVGWGNPFILLTMAFPDWTHIDVQLHTDDGIPEYFTTMFGEVTLDDEPMLKVVASGEWLSGAPFLENPPYPFEDGGGSTGNTLNGGDRKAISNHSGAVIFTANPNRPGSGGSSVWASMQLEAQAKSQAQFNIPVLGGDGIPDLRGAKWRLAAGPTYTYAYGDIVDGNSVIHHRSTSNGVMFVPALGSDEGFRAYLYRFWEPQEIQRVGTWHILYINAVRILRAVALLNEGMSVPFQLGVDIHTGGGEAGAQGGGHPVATWSLHSDSAHEDLDEAEFSSTNEDGSELLTLTTAELMARLQFTEKMLDGADFDMVGGGFLSGEPRPNKKVFVDSNGVSIRKP